MTKEDIIAVIKAMGGGELRIVQGAGEDRDYGWAGADANDGVTVGWDSGQRTALYGDDAEIA